MYQEHRRVLLGFGILTLIVLVGFTPKIASAKLIWSETFNELDEENWHFVECQIVDGVLRGVQQSPVTQEDRSAMRAYRHSNVTIGTWKFDMTEVGEWDEELDILKVYIISPHWPELSDYYALTLVHASNMDGIRYSYSIEKWYESSKTILDNHLGDTAPTGDGILQHFTITRTINGLFSVYLNSSLILQASDTSINTSGYFGFYTWDDWSFDNVYVYDSVESDITLPLLLAGVLIVGVIVVTILYLKK